MRYARPARIPKFNSDRVSVRLLIISTLKSPLKNSPWNFAQLQPGRVRPRTDRAWQDRIIRSLALKFAGYHLRIAGSAGMIITSAHL